MEGEQSGDGGGCRSVEVHGGGGRARNEEGHFFFKHVSSDAYDGK